MRFPKSWRSCRLDDDDFEGGGGGGGGIGDGVDDDPLNETITLPEPTAEDFAEIEKEKTKEAAFSFKHGEMEFKDQKALTEYIDGLGKKAAPASEDFETRLQKTLERERKEYDRRLRDTIAELNGGRNGREATPSQPAPKPTEEKNPFDPDTHLGQYVNWETEKAIKSATSPLLQQLTELKEGFGGYQTQADQDRTMRDFDRVCAREFAKVGVEKDTPEKIDELVMDLAAFDPRVQERGLDAVPEVISERWKALQAWKDRAVSQAVQKLVKDGKVRPNSVIRGAGAAVPRRVPVGEDKPMGKTLKGDNSTMAYLRRFNARQGSPSE